MRKTYVPTGPESRHCCDTVRWRSRAHLPDTRAAPAMGPPADVRNEDSPMALHTQESLSGFIASDPQLTYTERGDARLYVKIGQEHYRREDDGSFTQTETTFHDLVAFKKTAERAHDRLAKGDKFVAEGYVREYDRTTPEGEVIKAEEFVAKKLGHDLARTRYDVDRTRRQPAVTQEAAAQSVSTNTRREAASAVPALGL
jgi:single-stranded DNA-binding protein